MNALAILKPFRSIFNYFWPSLLPWIGKFVCFRVCDSVAGYNDFQHSLFFFFISWREYQHFVCLTFSKSCPTTFPSHPPHTQTQNIPFMITEKIKKVNTVSSGWRCSCVIMTLLLTLTSRPHLWVPLYFVLVFYSEVAWSPDLFHSVAFGNLAKGWYSRETLKKNVLCAWMWLSGKTQLLGSNERSLWPFWSTILLISSALERHWFSSSFIPNVPYLAFAAVVWCGC